MNILADSALPGLDEAFPAPFNLTRYHHPEEIGNLLKKQDILLCRSTLKVNQNLFKDHKPRYVATASSGTDHADRLYLQNQNITLIDAKGCNAISVADYVMSVIAYLQQKNQLKFKAAGIIGMGKVGTQVFSRLKAVATDIIPFDPLRELHDNVFKSKSIGQLYDCDLLCIHAEFHQNHPYPSSNLLNAEFFKRLKPGCVIINAARGGIVNEEDLLQVAESLIYCTDVFSNEPAIDKRIVAAATLCTPHIAGHSLEAKYNAVAIISKKLHDLMALPYPEFAKPVSPIIQKWNNDLPWQNQILSLYNPFAESAALKGAADLESTFISLRQKHQIRHDFQQYFNGSNKWINSQLPN